MKIPQWFAAFDALGARTDAAKAELLGVSRQRVNVVQSGSDPVGEKLIASALVALGCQFADVFEVRR